MKRTEEIAGVYPNSLTSALSSGHFWAVRGPLPFSLDSMNRLLTKDKTVNSLFNFDMCILAHVLCVDNVITEESVHCH